MKLRVVIHPGEDHGFWAEVPALPGCLTEGNTIEETLRNIREAAQGWLEAQAAGQVGEPGAQMAEIEL